MVNNNCRMVSDLIDNVFLGDVSPSSQRTSTAGKQPYQSRTHSRLNVSMVSRVHILNAPLYRTCTSGIQAA